MGLTYPTGYKDVARFEAREVSKLRDCDVNYDVVSVCVSVKF